MPLSRSSSRLRVESVRDEAGFLALKAAWNALAAEARESIFLRHEWFDAAWQWCQGQAQLALLAVREDERVIGLAPMIATLETRSRLPVRIRRFLTVPDTQLADVICRPADAERVGEALAEHLWATRRQWDALVWEYVPHEDAALAAVLRALGRRRAAVHQETFGMNWSVRLDRSWTEYYQTRSRRLKKSNNLIVNRLERAGAASIAHLTAGAEAAAVLEAIEPISRASWKTTTGTTFDQSGPQRFIRRLTETAAAAGWLSVWLLRLDGRPTAYEYQLRYAGALHGLRSDFDEGIAPGLSPGSYLNFKMLQSLFDAGAHTYFLGPGNNAYKLRWTEEGMALDRILVYGPTLKGRLLHWMETRLAPWWRRRQARRAAPAGAPGSGAPGDEQTDAGEAESGATRGGKEQA